jgi:hypothetical protein
MSRVFTVRFLYKEKTYTALVSFGSQEREFSHTVQYLDEDIDALIPGRKLLVSLADGVQQPKLIGKLAQDIVYKTTEAINEYLQHHEDRI